MHVGPVRLIILLLLAINILEAQSTQKHSDGPATSSLRVTATVVPSVWLIMDPDGKQETVVANAPDPKEAFVHVATPQKLKATKTILRNSYTPAPQQPTPTTSHRTTQPRNQGDASIQFSFLKPKQFEVKQEIKVMDVDVNGKTERQPVAVTTVVPQ
jgi:hypothetical protein